MKPAVSVPDDLFRLADAAARRLRVSRSQLLAHQLHHTLGDPSLQKFDEGIDRSSAILADGFPARLRDRSYPHLNLVDLRAADQGFDFARRNLKIDHGTVAHIGPPAWQAVFKVAIAFQVVAPSLAPEGLDNRAAFHHHRRDWMALLFQLGHLAGRFPAPLRHRNIGSPSVKSHRSHVSFSALFMSSATSLSNSSSFISVNSRSAPPSSKSVESCRFDSISWSILSSTVPRHTNLCTRTFLVWPMRKARSVAWFSTAGFHQRSKCTTCEAAVRLRPAPPALSERTKNPTASSS